MNTHRNLPNVTLGCFPKPCQNLNNKSPVQYDWEKEGNPTPKPGYKSITVKTEIYDYFYNEWLKVKEDYTLSKGVRSFSGYVNYRLDKLMKQEK